MFLLTFFGGLFQLVLGWILSVKSAIVGLSGGAISFFFHLLPDIARFLVLVSKTISLVIGVTLALSAFFWGLANFIILIWQTYIQWTSILSIWK